MALTESDIPEENTPISFPTRKTVLAQAGLPDEPQCSHVREIRSILRFFTMAHAAVTVALARHDVARFGAGDTPARVALRGLMLAASGATRGARIAPKPSKKAWCIAARPRGSVRDS